jgi:hypothetical protein
VAAWSNKWVCGRSLAGIVGWNATEVMDVCLCLVSVVCCQVEISATGRSLVQRSSTECGVSEYHSRTSTMGGLGPLGPSSHENNNSGTLNHIHELIIKKTYPPTSAVIELSMGKPA